MWWSPRCWRWKFLVGKLQRRSVLGLAVRGGIEKQGCASQSCRFCSQGQGAETGHRESAVEDLFPFALIEAAFGAHEQQCSVGFGAGHRWALCVGTEAFLGKFFLIEQFAKVTGWPDFGQIAAITLTGSRTQDPVPPLPAVPAA